MDLYYEAFLYISTFGINVNRREHLLPPIDLRPVPDFFFQLRSNPKYVSFVCVCGLIYSEAGATENK